MASAMSDKPDNYGQIVYQSLMDLDLLLTDIGEMGPLRMFLGSIDPNNHSLEKLHKEIESFTQRIQNLANAAKQMK